jgi:lambda family phage minor tail protein L
MTINQEVLKLKQDSLIDLFEVDLRPTGLNVIYYFVNDKETNGESVKFNGKNYVAFPVEAKGFEEVTKAPFPKPTLTFSNVSGTVSSIMLLNNDLVGAAVIRHRTYVKYLDGHSSGGGGYELFRQVYTIERPIEESELSVSFEMVNGLELENLTLPRRYMIRRCTWLYRGPDCSYTGNAMFTKQDQPTGDMREDKCSRTIKGCKLRFGNNSELPMGGFPGLDPS